MSLNLGRDNASFRAHIVILVVPLRGDLTMEYENHKNGSLIWPYHGQYGHALYHPHRLLIVIILIVHLWY